MELIVYLNVLIDVYHSINSFMATDAGELFEKSVELVMFTIVTYMIASEYGRSKEKHLLYLLIGFGALALNKLIMSFVYAIVVFGDVRFLIFNPFLPMLDLFLEIFALVLMTNSFIFPIFADRQDRLKKNILSEIYIIIIIALLIEAYWFIAVKVKPDMVFQGEISYLLLELLKIMLLYVPIYYILTNFEKFRKYGPHIIIAFAVYMITPFTNVINTAFYGGLNSNLRVFAHPFPFISVLLFTRVIYLKLVDKAMLKKQLETTRQKYVQEQELSVMKDEFVSTVSHELKTPLTSMKLYLSLLKQDRFGKINAKQLKAVNVVEKEANRLMHLIADILNLSRLEAKKDVLRKERINLCKLVNDNLYYNMAEQKGLSIKNNVPKKFLVYVDPEKFKQVFINLFSNAVNYARKKIVIDASMTADGWEFVVGDDGEGIPSDKLEKLFDKFYRVGDYLTKGKKGTGLGLSIVKNIVELHGGSIRAESITGKGSRFIVSMPFSS